MVVPGNLSAGAQSPQASMASRLGRWRSADFNVRQLQAMANAVAVIFLPTPASPVKEQRMGHGSVADEGLEQLDGRAVGQRWRQIRLPSSFSMDSGRLKRCDTFDRPVPLPADAGRQIRWVGMSFIDPPVP
jgi:hypothetical protein